MLESYYNWDQIGSGAHQLYPVLRTHVQARGSTGNCSATRDGRLADAAGLLPGAARKAGPNVRFPIRPGSAKRVSDQQRK